MPSISRERQGNQEKYRTNLNKMRACWNLSEDKIKCREMNNEVYYLRGKLILLDIQIVKREINSVAVSRDNRFIVSGSHDKSIKVFDLQTKQQLHHFARAHTSTIILSFFLSFLLPRHSSSFIEGVTSVAVSSDNRFIVSGSYDNTIKVFDLQTKQQLHHFADAHTSTIILSFFPFFYIATHPLS